MPRDEGRYYRDVASLQEAYSAESTNTLLQSGWELLKIAETTKSTVTALASGGNAVESQTSFVYILGKPRAEPASPGQQQRRGADIEGAADHSKHQTSDCNRCGNPICFHKE